MASSKLGGGPHIERSQGAVRVRQSKLPGWGMLGFGLGIPALAALGGVKPPASAAAWAGLAVAGLFFGGFALYGLVWVAWTRELDVALGRWTFRTGFGPWLKESEGPVAEVRLIHLWRKQLAGPSPGVDPGGPESGAPVESWELRLAVPGTAEPLFLGEWGLKAEAQAELALWQALFQNAGVDEKA